MQARSWFLREVGYFGVGVGVGVVGLGADLQMGIFRWCTCLGWVVG